MFVFKNREAFPLTKNEKIIRGILRILLFTIVCTFLIAVLQQNQNENVDDLLVTIFITAFQPN